MSILATLEQKQLISKETVELFTVSVIIFFLSLILFRLHFYLAALGLLLMVLGGLANLYVIDYNKLRMPVLNLSRRQLAEAKRRQPSRRFCKLDRSTKLAWLADRFQVGKGVYSLGDFIMYFGVVVVVPEVVFRFLP
ncbi:MAG: DUF5317 family protein [Patescibacteria group bacterium]